MLKKIHHSVISKINEQNEFIKASIYVNGGFFIIIAGYGVGRLVGKFVF